MNKRELKSLIFAVGGKLSHKDSYGEGAVKRALGRLNIKYKTESLHNLHKYDPQVYWSRFDFYLPEHRTVIEFNGSQHYKRNPKLQKTEYCFIHQQKRDEAQRQYCKNNNIVLITIRFSALRKGFTKNLQTAILSGKSCELI